MADFLFDWYAYKLTWRFEIRFKTFTTEQNSQEKYGDVFKLFMFDEAAVCTTDRDAIREILITKNYPKSVKQFEFITFPLNTRYYFILYVFKLLHSKITVCY